MCASRIACEPKVLAAVDRTYLGEQLKKKLVRLGVAGTLAALSLAAVAVPAQAAVCGPVVDSVKICTDGDGSSYPAVVSKGVTGPVPGIGGALMVGNTLTVFDGPWDPLDAKLTHQWLRNDVPIVGATGTTYRIRSADAGKSLRVITAVTAPGYQGKAVKSAKTGIVTNTGGAIPTVTSAKIAKVVTDGGIMLQAWTSYWFSPGTQRHYQWLQDGAPIPGATGTTYRLSPADSGKKFQVRVTGYKPGYDSATLTSPETEVVQYPKSPTPGSVVTGGTGIGAILTGTDDVPWTSGELQLEHRYQWLRNGTAIPGATGLTYTVAAEDQGATLVLLTDTDTVDAYSNLTAIPAAAGLLPLTNLTRPVLSGESITGAPMTVTAGTWSEPAENLTITYEWVSTDWRVRATGQTFLPGKEHIGATASVVVTATAPGYATTRTRVTAPTPVRIPDPTQTWAPLTGAKPVVGKTISATPGRWSNRDWQVKATYQWLRDGTAIPGATGQTYVPVGADFGKNLSVTVTSTLGGRVLKTQTVTAASQVAAGTLATAMPKLAGTAKVGTVLKAVPGAWSPGTAFKYRWLRNGVIISNAHSATYKVRTADKNAKITVRVTGSLLGYPSVSRDSKAFLAR